MSLGRWLVAAALVVAMADWVAVARGSKRAEFVLKPMTLVLMIGAAVAFRSDVIATRWAFVVAALTLSLAGDAFLMLPKDLFVAGLASFLLAHAAYVAAFAVMLNVPPRARFFYPDSGFYSAYPWRPALIASAVVLPVAGAVFLRIRRGMVASGRRELVVPVAIYVLAIAAMVVNAFATLGRPYWSIGGRTFAIAGALLFFASDTLIGWTRFVTGYRWGPIAIMVTYHLGQAALVLGLLGSTVTLSV